MRRETTDEAGHLLLDGELQPGLFTGVEVDGGLEIDQQQVPGASETARQIQGYRPATVTFKLTLPTDESTCFEKLKVIAQRFKQTDASAAPLVRRIVNEHTAAWGIDQVLFRELRSSDNNKTDMLTVELVFEEWTPSIRRKEAGSGSASSSSTAQLSPELMALLGFTSGGTSSRAHPTDPARQALLADPAPAPW